MIFPLTLRERVAFSHEAQAVREQNNEMNVCS